MTIPSQVIDGNIMVNDNTGANVGLSNAWPIDIGGGGNPGDPPSITSIDPTLGPAGGWTPVTITGTGFSDVDDVEFGGLNAFSFQANSNTELVAETPTNVPFSSVSLYVHDPDGLLVEFRCYPQDG